MATGSNDNMPARESIEFDASDVVVVVEDEGRPAEVIEQLFTLRARYWSDASVFFRLFPATDRGCLQIKAGDIESLGKEVYGKAKPNQTTPPHFKHICDLLDGVQSVTCLRFQLHGNYNIDLIRPYDSNTETTSGDLVPDTCASLKPLAAARLISLYFRHDLLSQKIYKKYKWAIEQFANLTEGQARVYESVVDVSRLYHGAGDKVLISLDDHVHSPTRESSSSPAPGTPSSYGSTLPFDTVPRGSPPPYNACVGEELSSTSGPGAAATLAISSGGGGDLPGYDDTERRDDAPDSSRGVRPCGKEDIDTQRIKRKRLSYTATCTTTTSATDGSRPEKPSRPSRPHAIDRLMHIVEEQQKDIRRLQQKLEKSDARVAALAQNVDELEEEVSQLKKKGSDYEERCSQLEYGQAENAETLERHELEIDDIQGTLSTVDELMLVQEECLDGSQKDIERDPISPRNIAKRIDKVEDGMNSLKRRLREALETI
ncbi:hypothetical protein CCUS01_11260 [Colletotrichum cuscutae]|uniref:Uncharacterized protein n=1 Tax=Colletotrichum cuscutae TaxID=1209917 RepID=A0AAI9U777_9PEZI|nr:hypothetical protein CCUS01_11260 [Colletotrichum cuscutae]